jgi:hypothetical protein
VCQAKPNPEQVWKLAPAGGGFYYVTSHVSGLNLSVSGASRERAAKIVQAKPDPDQVWKFAAAPDAAGK